MKKTLLILLAILIAAPANAQWVYQWSDPPSERYRAQPTYPGTGTADSSQPGYIIEPERRPLIIDHVGERLERQDAYYQHRIDHLIMDDCCRD